MMDGLGFPPNTFPYPSLRINGRSLFITIDELLENSVYREFPVIHTRIETQVVCIPMGQCKKDLTPVR